MKTALIALALLATAAAPPPLKKLTPPDIVNAAPASAWREVPAGDLMVMTLEGGKQVVIQLAPRFAPVHVANIRALARSDYWRDSTIYRVQDNYVVQWGIGDAKRPLAAGVVASPPHEYWMRAKGMAVTPLSYRDSFAPRVGYVDGWPVAVRTDGTLSTAHCYGSLGVGRDLAPDTGSGAELYAVIGPARALDRNIAVVGRVVSGIENLSSLERGTEALGFYNDKQRPTKIIAIGIAADMPAETRPRFEYLSETSAAFARYLNKKANRDDDFYRVAAGGVDVCSAAVPVRRIGTSPKR